jgi:protein-disulfide isomerase
VSEVNKRAWIIFSVVVIGLLGALVIASRSANPQIDTAHIDANTIQAPSKANGNIGDHVFGNASSKVILIEYGDYQCPGCGGAYPRLKTISEAYKAQLAFVFRNFPLTTIHPNARAAAGAAEAAGLSGKFWEMHNSLYQNQNSWQSLSGDDRTNTFSGYATALGITQSTFTTNLADDAINRKISFDQAIAKKIGVDSTPTFYLNGVKLEGTVWSNEAKFAEAINTELKKIGVTPPTFTAATE